MRTNTDLRHIYPVISGVLTGGDGVTYSLDGHSVPAGSLSFKSGTSPGGTFAIGGAVIGSVSFALINSAGAFSSVVWKNAKVEFTLTCGQTAVNMGRYFIVSHSESGGVVSVTAMDALKILDEHEMSELTISYPTTAGALASAIASAHGLNVSGMRIPSLTIDDPGDAGMTQRACLSHLAQVSGQFVQDKEGTLTFGWYDINSQYDDGATFGHDWNTGNTTITGIRVIDKESTTTEDRGVDGYRIEVSGNPFINATNASAIADTIWNACGGMTFRAGSAEILASPAFEAGDTVTVRTNDETGVKLILSNITYTPDVSMSVSSDADDADSDLSLNKRPYIKKNEAKQAANEAIADQLADTSSDLSRAISGAGGGVSDIQLASDTLLMASYFSDIVRINMVTGGISHATLTSNGRITIDANRVNIIIPSYEKANYPMAKFTISFPFQYQNVSDGSTDYAGMAMVELPCQYMATRPDVLKLLIYEGTTSNQQIVYARIMRGVYIDILPFLPIESAATASTPCIYLVKKSNGLWRFQNSYQ